MLPYVESVRKKPIVPSDVPLGLPFTSA
jgi:hypothetical protein